MMPILGLACWQRLDVSFSKGMFETVQSSVYLSGLRGNRIYGMIWVDASIDNCVMICSYTCLMIRENKPIEDDSGATFVVPGSRLYYAKALMAVARSLQFIVFL